MYEHILVPTDGSEGTEHAVEHAIDMATTYDAVLHGLFVVDIDGYPDEVSEGSLIEQLEASGEDVVDELTERADAAGVRAVETAVVTGQTYRAILDYVDAHDVDLVVMGTHGQRGLEPYAIGGVADKVMRLSDVPVMTVRLAEPVAQSSE
ncbi:universal stress protein [Halobacteriaceae archaeon GCM10025711]